MGIVASRHFLATTRLLLTAEPGIAATTLFQQAGLPASTAYRVLRFYEYHGALRAPSHIQTDSRRILTLQGGLRAERAIPDRRVAQGPSLSVALDLLKDLDIPHALGLQSAANQHAYFEPVSAHTLYIDQAPTAGESRQRAAAVDKALGQRTDRTDQDRYEIFLDHLDRLDIATEAKRPITSPIQTLLDLCLHHRTAAHREFMYTQLKRQGAFHG